MKDLRIRDRGDQIVTQGAFNALLCQLDSLQEDNECLADENQNLRVELDAIYATALKGLPSPSSDALARRLLRPFDLSVETHDKLIEVIATALMARRHTFNGDSRLFECNDCGHRSFDVVTLEHKDSCPNRSLNTEERLEITALTEAALSELERVDTIKLAAMGRDQDAGSVSRARRFLDRLIAYAVNNDLGQ